MRKFILIFLVINFHLVAYNQVIKGTVIDTQTKSAISFASVYFNGTFVGTTSDMNGNFQLDISKNPSTPLIISAIGYYSVTLADFSTDKPLLVSMTPKLYYLDEVVSSSKSLLRKRKEYLKIFKDEFLGTITNALNCEIMNENDITFNYGSDRDTLKAFTSNPILINNKALGYKITYYLDKFEYSKKINYLFFRGNIIFNEDTTIEGTKNKLYEKRRKNAYSGSRMHFFRTLWADSLEFYGFKIKNSDNQYLNYKDIVIQDDNNEKSLKYSGNLFIEYAGYLSIGYYYSLSKIVFNKEQVYFDKNGYFDSMGINWQGEMVKKRIADCLPYEYKIR